MKTDNLDLKLFKRFVSVPVLSAFLLIGPSSLFATPVFSDLNTIFPNPGEGTLTATTEINEDVDGDGTLDVNEDLDGDGNLDEAEDQDGDGLCLLYTSPSPRDRQKSRMPSSA